MNKESKIKAIQNATGINRNDFFEDLNACHEMRKFVKNKAAYCDAVKELTNIGAGSWCDWEFAKLNTTAAQEAEAFGKSHNLW